MICRGCHFHMSFTESDRGQVFCNRCEMLLLHKLGAAMTNTPVGMEERERSLLAFEALEVPEFEPYAYLGNMYLFFRPAA